jgi:pimeloyl-ACP methyl ester carboxylesterase
MGRPAIIMVHGAFSGGWAFDVFRKPFERAGFRVITPDLPGHVEGGGREQVVGLSMAHYAKTVAALVASEPTPPILLGHSMGGLVSQMAAQSSVVHALILLAPSPPWGVVGGSMEEAISAASLYALGPFWMQAIDPDYGVASQYTLNGVAKAERRALFGRMGSESGRALWETLSWWLDPFMTTRVDANRINAPSLVLAGEKDLIHPPATVRETARRLGAPLDVLKGMSHWIVSEPGWETVADHCLEWLDQVIEDAPQPLAANRR